MNNDPMDLSVPAPAVALRPECAGDEAFLFAVYAGTREDEMALTGWDAATRGRFLEFQFRAMRQGYGSRFPHAEFAIILLEGRPVGRAVVDRDTEAVHVVDVALLGPERNRGIGTRLLGRWCAEAAATHRVVRLSVLKGNRALRFYDRLGFTPVGDEGLYLCLEWRPPGATPVA
jgi:GNAT superfamily N-acetyltransferase